MYLPCLSTLRRVRPAHLLLLLASLAACADDSGSTLDSQLGALARARCICGAREALDACQQSERALLDATLGARVEATLSEVDPTRLRACTDALETCPGYTPAACEGMVTGLRPLGAPCAGDEECETGFCESDAGVGACHGTCEAPSRLIKDACVRHADCELGMHCLPKAPNFDVRACVAPLALGEDCLELARQLRSRSAQLCADGLACISDGAEAATCQPPLEEDEDCLLVGVGGTTQCAYGLYCEATTATCLPDTKPPTGSGRGQACDPFNDRCAPAMFCQPMADAPAQGSCQPVKAEGEVCTARGECLTECHFENEGDAEGVCISAARRCIDNPPN